MVFAIPERLRLDNAANIYPASMSKDYSSLYRMSVTLNEPVDKETLQKALRVTADRIPTFRCGLVAGRFWWYLDRLENRPQVLPFRPLRPFRFQEQGGFLYRVSTDGNRIVLDMFHALADGYGAMSFLLTLTGEYLRRRHNLDITYNSLVLDPADKPVYAEVEDSFKSVFTGRKGQLEKNDDAFHIPGDVMKDGHVKDLRAVLSMEDVRRVCREKACTVTELMTAAMLSSLQELHRENARRRTPGFLKVSVPVNLRPLYGSRTVRNFSSYVNLGVNVKDGYLSIDELIAAVQRQKEHDLRKENLEPKIAANVELEENPVVCCLPLMVKHPIIDLINRLHGDRFYSQTLSNLGIVRLPEALLPYVQDVDFVLGRQRGNSGACSCVGFGDKLYFHLSRKIGEDSFEQGFLRQLSQLGITVETSLSTLA